MSAFSRDLECYLAEEMGLGKTIQAFVALRVLLQWPPETGADLGANRTGAAVAASGLRIRRSG